MWPLIAIAFFFAFTLGCKKDFSVPAEIAEPIDWKVSQEQFDNAKASLKGEAATRFFDFDFAAQNNPNVVPVASGRDENEDALRALCVELIAQNQQYNFASELISRVGYPMWSRAMFYTNSSQMDAPAVVLPFSQLNDDSTRAFIYATPIDNYWHIKLVTRYQVDSLLSNAPNSENLHFKVGMLGMFDKQIFDNPTVRYVNFIFGHGLTTTADDRCIWVYSATIICAPDIAFTTNDPAGDRGCITIEYTDCVEYGSGMGGNGSSWFNGGGGLTQGNGEGGGGWGGGLSDPFSDPFGGASQGFLNGWQAYLGITEPDGGSQQGGNLTPGQIARFEQVNVLNDLGLFSFGQLEVAYNNSGLTNALIAYLQTHSGDPTAQEVASLLLLAVGLGDLNESQALTLLELQQTLDLTVEQVRWLFFDTNIIAQIDNFVSANPNAPLLQEGMQAHINLLMTDHVYFAANANANFPAIGTEAWASTLTFDFDGSGVQENANPAEKLLALSELPFSALAALAIKENAPIANQRTALVWAANGLNNKSDAFRHAFFLAMNTRDVGNVWAWAFAEAHETSTPAELSLEEDMDRFNNGVGISLWQANPTSTDDQLATIVQTALLSGELRYLSPLNFIQSQRQPVGLNGIIPSTQLIPTNQ